MNKWKYMTVKVALDAGKGAYRVIQKGRQNLGDEGPFLSDFLIEMTRQGWEYVHLVHNLVTLKTLRKE